MSRITRLNPGVGSSTPAYVFDVTKSGAVGDGQEVNDGAMTSGQATLTSATANFTANDVGKYILVKGAAASGITTLSSKITAFTNSTTVTLQDAAATTVSGAYVLWGTDDTAAFQSAVNAAVAYAQAHSGYGEVFIPASVGAFYMIAGALQAGGSTKGNAQITLPIIPVASNKVTLRFRGAGDSTGLFHWNQTIPQMSPSTLVSTGVFAGGVSAQSNSINTNGNPCVIGGPAQPGGYGTSALLFSNMLVVLDSLTILTPYSSFGLNYSAADFSGVAEANVFDCSIGVPNTYSDLQSPNSLSTGASIGLLMPANGNNDNNAMRNFTVNGGFTRALYATEHTNINSLRILYCWGALFVIGAYFTSVGASHAVYVDAMSCEGCIRHVQFEGSAQNGQGPTVTIGQLDTEGTPIIYDNSNGGAGGFGLGDIAFTGFNAPTMPNPTGVKLKNLIQQPGRVTAPTFTSGTPFQNTFGRDATVTLAGVTNVSVGIASAGKAPLGGSSAPTMQALGITSGTIRVPAYGWITITGTPTTNVWILD